MVKPGRKTTGPRGRKVLWTCFKNRLQQQEVLVIGRKRRRLWSVKTTNCLRRCPAENIELSPSLPGENNELSPSSVVGQNNELSPSLPGENIELSPPLPGENNELSPSSVVAEHRGPSCPLVVGENPTFSSSKPQSDTKLPKASTLSNWRQIYEWLEITERNTMICKIMRFTEGANYSEKSVITHGIHSRSVKFQKLCLERIFDIRVSSE